MRSLSRRLCSSLFLLLSVAQAHDIITTKITWTKEISRLVYKRCATCHREGGSSFSLMTYEEARPWAKAIKEEVLERRMPPWEAVKGFGEFRDDRGLTQEELETISSWVEGGAPEGRSQISSAASESGRLAGPCRAQRIVGIGRGRRSEASRELQSPGHPGEESQSRRERADRSGAPRFVH